MTMTIPSNPVAEEMQRLQDVLDEWSPRMIACSGGIDSVLLATIAFRSAPAQTRIAHAISPAVPQEATQRVRDWAEHEGWNVEWVQPGEFDDERYLSNPVNRCYYCKSNLYQSLQQLNQLPIGNTVLMSGANLDDLGEYRPGLIAAEERNVQHPYIQAQIDKATIRAIARHLALPFSEIPASPCLASRLYTGTRVTSNRLAAVEAGEQLLRQRAGIDVVRCRVREREMTIEVTEKDRERITMELLNDVQAAALQQGLQLDRVALDAKPYFPGRAFLGTEGGSESIVHIQS